MELISIEAAQNEWIEYLKENDAISLIPDESMKDSSNKEDRDEYKSNKQSLDIVARAISTGHVVIKNGVITQKLKYPIESKNNGDFCLSELVYNGRWTDKDRQTALLNIDMDKASDKLLLKRRMMALICNQDATILQRLDGKDIKVSDIIISVFFM